MKKIGLYTFGLLLSIACIQVNAQSIEEQKPANKQSILNGRAFFMFPAKAVNNSRPVDIMAAEPDTNNETRITYDENNVRMVFFAEELYVTSGKQGLLGVTNNNKAFETKVLTDKDSLFSVVSTPTGFDSTKDAILINSLLVKMQDNSVIRISAYINPAGYDLREQYKTLAEKVFGTLSPGTRRLDFKARTDSFQVLNDTKKLIVDIPEGYIATKDKGDDFQVLKFQKMKDISDTNWLNLMVYTGFYPSFFYNEYNLDTSKAIKVQSVFMGHNVSWFYFKNEQFYLKEQMMPGDDIEKGLIIHIAMLSNKKRSIDELTTIVGKISISGE